MHNHQTVSLGPWYGLLCFGAGSLLSVVISTVDSGWGPLSGIRPLVGLTVLFWTALGGVTAAYVLIGRGWRVVERRMRLRLASAYFGLVWGGLFALLMTTPAAMGLVVLLGIIAAIVYIANGLEHRQRNQDESEMFP